MAINTYATLKTAVANYLQRDDLTSRIPEFISLAEDRAALTFRIRPMEASADLTISARTVALPTGFIGTRRLYINTSTARHLDYLAPEDFWSKYASTTTGIPKVYTIEGENIVVGPAPDSSYTGKLLYWKRLDDLSSDSDTNWWLSNARGILLYGALVEASPYIGDDPRIPVWAGLWEDLSDRVRASDRKDRTGATPVVRSEVYVD